ncbi:hypothetical protein [Polaromonas sp.]|nr:hypothetical protein [Polaromonas sp.]NMM08404.1 hypothetical protein [Polaromonas sp.]
MVLGVVPTFIAALKVTAGLPLVSVVIAAMLMYVAIGWLETFVMRRR